MKVCLRFFDFHILKYCQTWLNIHTYGEFATWETSHIIEKNLGEKKKQKNTAPKMYTNPGFSFIIDWKFVYPFW
jgi:hypothetical protein